MSDATIHIDAAGVMRFLWNDDFAALADEGTASIRRVSHVEPVGNQWMADLSPVGGPLLGPFSLRRDALAAEVRWVEEHHLQNNL